MRTGLTIAAILGLQIAFSLGFQLVVLRALGAGALTDAFVAAQTVPTLLVAIIVTPLQSLWQPHLSVAAADTAKWRGLQGVAQTQVLVLMGSVGVAVAGGASLWFPLLFPGIPANMTPLAVEMTRILMLGALFNAHSALLIVALRAQERFVLAEGVGASLAALALLAVWRVAPEAGVRGAAWVVVARAFLATAVLYLLAGRPQPRLNSLWRIHETWKQLRLVAAGTSIYKLGPLIDRYLGSLAPSGGLTLLSLAQTGIGALAQVMERAICMPATPRLARLAHDGDYHSIRAVVRQRVVRVSLVIVGIVGMLLALRPAWTELLAFLLLLPPDTALDLWWLCILLIGYLHVAASGTVPVAAFYALGDTRTPVRVGVIGFIVGVGLKSIGFFGWGLPGLVAATSAYYIINMAAMMVLLERALDARTA